MTQKKINGYVIFLKEILGKGSYGSVLISIKQVYRGQQDGTKLECAVKVLEKKLSKQWGYKSWPRRVPKERFVFLDSDIAVAQVGEHC